MLVGARGTEMPQEAARQMPQKSSLIRIRLMKVIFLESFLEMIVVKAKGQILL